MQSEVVIHSNYAELYVQRSVRANIGRQHAFVVASRSFKIYSLFDSRTQIVLIAILEQNHTEIFYSL